MSRRFPERDSAVRCSSRKKTVRPVLGRTGSMSPGSPSGGPSRSCGSVNGEAVDQARAAGAYQSRLAAARAGVRRVPGVIAAAAAIGVAELHGHALNVVAAGVVRAGVVRSVGVGAARGRRAGEHVVTVGVVALAVDKLALLAESGVLVEVV